jgi:hypothetical protein
MPIFRGKPAATNKVTVVIVTKTSALKMWVKNMAPMRSELAAR